MQFKRVGAVLVAAVVFSLSIVSIPVNAAVLTLGNSGWRAHFTDGVDLNLIGVTGGGSNVKVDALTEFTDPFDRGVGPTLQITFVQICDDAAETITIDPESILNQTGSDWAGFTYSLTQTTGGGSSDDVEFDSAQPPANTPPFGDHTFSNDLTELQFHDGFLHAGDTWLADEQFVIRAAPASSGVKTSFLLTLQPIEGLDPDRHTPEPGSLTATVAFGLLALRRRRR